MTPMPDGAASGLADGAATQSGQGLSGYHRWQEAYQAQPAARPTGVTGLNIWGGLDVGG